MDAAWLNKEPEDHSLNAKVIFAGKAKAAGKWIYDSTTKILYSPDEFVWDRNLIIQNARRGGEFGRFNLVDVKEILVNKREAAVKLLKEIDVLEKRIWQFYKLVPKK